jgi:protein-S-isoprenylcysteine O-methyltransferase Ste14
MPENVQTTTPAESPPSVSNLVAGIISDAERLVRQEITLARREIQLEWEKAKMAAVAMAVGLLVCLLAATFLGTMAVYMIHELGGVPLYGAYAIVGLVCAVLGAVLLYVGWQQASKVHVVPPQTAETIKENVQWMQNQTPT